LPTVSIATHAPLSPMNHIAAVGDEGPGRDEGPDDDGPSDRAVSPSVAIAIAIAVARIPGPRAMAGPDVPAHHRGRERAGVAVGRHELLGPRRPGPRQGPDRHDAGRHQCLEGALHDPHSPRSYRLGRGRRSAPRRVIAVPGPTGHGAGENRAAGLLEASLTSGEVIAAIPCPSAGRRPTRGAGGRRASTRPVSSIARPTRVMPPSPIPEKIETGLMCFGLPRRMGDRRARSIVALPAVVRGRSPQ